MKTNSAVRTAPAGRRGQTDSATVSAAGNIAPLRTTCSTCNLRELCPPCCGLSRAERDAADHLVINRPRLRRGDNLYHAGDRFTCLYAVRSGFFKSTAVLDNGRDQVTGYTILGEILGMDAIGSGRYTCDAIALEDSEVCAISYAGLQALAHEISSLQHHFRSMMSREILREQGVMLLLGSMNADERLALFLLELSRRYAAQGRSASAFDLRMTRAEVGSYLGLKLETISRTLSKFHDEGLIEVQQKFIRILDADGLDRVVGRGQD